MRVVINVVQATSRLKSREDDAKGALALGRSGRLWVERGRDQIEVDGPRIGCSHRKLYRTSRLIDGAKRRDGTDSARITPSARDSCAGALRLGDERKGRRPY